MKKQTRRLTLKKSTVTRLTLNEQKVIAAGVKTVGGCATYRATSPCMCIMVTDVP